ncbi:MAG: 6-phosphogluconolactonase [Chlorobiaceae bacterium]|nr:6-phosphogluconolactonase [Chlorobiaceae bacterium]
MTKNRILHPDGDDRELTALAAALIISAANRAVATHGKFSLVLAGGNSPRRLYQQLAVGINTGDLSESSLLLLAGNENSHSGHRYLSLPWEHTWFFWGDERCLPSNHSDSNYRMAEESLFKGSALREKQLFSMPATIEPPDRAADLYESTIRRFFPQNRHAEAREFPVFDFILLGLGEDGHIASLFPRNHAALNEQVRWVIAVNAPEADPPGYRLTMTLPVINHAKNVLFFTSGTKKRAVAERIISRNDENLPAGRVQPVNGNLFWFTLPGIS